MSACISAKVGGLVAGSGAVLAVADVSPIMGAVESYGIVGILCIIAVTLWAKSERQEREASKYREERAKREQAEGEKMVETLTNLTNALTNLKDHCAAVNYKRHE